MNFLRQLLDIITAPIRLLLAVPRKLLDSSRRMAGMSLPARVAVLTAILLVLVVIAAVLGFIYTHERAFWRAKLTPTFGIAIALLVLVIPLALYKALQLWLEGEVSPYPDIDRAWKAGLEELDRAGIELKQVPLFLVLGASGMRQEKSLFEAARLDLGMREIPAGAAPIHWYAGASGIYLVCSAIGCQSRIAALAGEAMSSERSHAAPRRDAGSIRGTVVAGSPALSGTSLGPPARQSSPAPSAGHPGYPLAGRGSAAIQGTMIVGSQSGGDDGESAAPVDDKRVIKLEQAEVIVEENRLAYLARLIRRARQPLCPINGILNLVPFGMIQRSSPDAAAVERATRSDLGTLRRTLMVCCPATALVTGIEEESGFRELLRRVGRERALNQRFGKGFSVSNVPLGERLEAVAIHACGAFEDWIYNLFREADSLSKPGNAKLYSLLCKVRHRVQERLARILMGGYSCDPDDASADPRSASGYPARPDGLRFGGCYFAGTGDSEDRQAFVSAVVGKLQEQEEELQWTDEALRQDDRYHWASQLVLVLDLLLLAALAGEVFYVWFWKGGL